MNYLTLILKSAPVLIILSVGFIITEFCVGIVFTSQFNSVFNPKEPLTLAFMVAYTLVCLLAAPLALGKFIFNESPRELGLCLPKNRLRAALFTLAALLLLIPVVFFSAQHREVQVFYSLKNLSPAKFIFIFFFLLPPYYLAEEFFFRGFLFLRLWSKLGWHSYWITELLFTWAHLGKPWLEILLAFPIGIVLNYITLKTRSIYPAMVVHFTMGALMNIVVTFFI